MDNWNRFLQWLSWIESFTSPASKVSKFGRYSGGILVLIKYLIDVRFSENAIVVFDKAVLDYNIDIVCVFSYIQPEGSSWYNDKGRRVELLVNLLLARRVYIDIHFDV